MKGLTLEFKVGFFVLVGIILLSMIVFQIGGLNLFRADTYKVNVIFDFVNGLAQDAPVHVAGVAVGDVKKVEVFYSAEQKKTQVRLELIIKNKVRIPRDSVAYINTLGILGEKYVEIVPGEDREHFLRNNDFIIGNNPVQIEKLTESLVDVIGDQTVRDSVRESFYNMRVATEKLRESTENLNEIVLNIKGGNGTIGKFLYDDTIYTQAEEMVTNLNTKLDKTITDLNNSLNDLVSDLKRHPWKLFMKPPKKRDSRDMDADEDENKKKGNGGVIFSK